EAVHHFAKAADLPGDLVDRAALVVMRQQAHTQAAGENHEGMMIGSVAHEVAGGGAVLSLFFRRQAMAEIEGIGDAEAETLRVEVARGVDIFDVETEVSEPADFEWPLHPH